MSPYAITCIIVFGAAGLLYFKGARPLWLFGLTGLAFLAAGVAMDLIPSLASQVPHLSRLTTASPINFARPVGTLLLGVTAFLALQQGVGAMYLPRLTRWLFWPLAGGLALAPIVQTLTLGQIPRRYTEVPDRFSAAHTLEVTLAYVTYAAGAALLALFLGSLLWRLKTVLHRAK
jgi:hypothetical protein